MEKIKIGILREGKVPPDKRVPLSPKQCIQVIKMFSGVEIIVQPSPIRAFSDDEYQALGLELKEDLSECEILLGVKEVNIQDLIPEKKFLFFSHTVKKQAYNRGLLQAIVDKKIQLVDYELLKNNDRKRVTGFGRFAGIVGAYNGIYAFGLKTGNFELKRAKDCFDRKEMEAELAKVKFDKNLKVVLTGFGKVGYGAREILDLLPIMEVSPDEYLNNTFDSPVFTHLETSDYYQKKADGTFDKTDFYSNPELYIANLNRYVESADIYMSCHFWSNRSPKLLTQNDLISSRNLKVVADISCDINDPIACTLRPSTIADPLYGYDAQKHSETDWRDEASITVMAVDNLPCELPKEASEDFGVQLINNVIPHLLTGDSEGRIFKASQTTLDGKLNEPFEFLQDYLDGTQA